MGFVLYSLICIAFFDVYWILRLIITKMLAKHRSRLRHDDESVTYNICWTTDIDYFFHMNNGKYFREMDFGRFDFYFRAGFDKYIQAQTKMYFVQHGACIRYRRSINFLVPFKLVTKLVYWDERSLYFEQQFVSLHDNFVRAVALCKNTCVGGTVTSMLTACGVAGPPPPPPEEVALWIRSQEVSSTRLKMTGHGPSVAACLAALDPATADHSFNCLGSVPEGDTLLLDRGMPCEEQLPKEKDA